MNNKIITNSGLLVNPTRLRVNDINITDIAHALSNLCRFAGHVNQFYSVASHSIAVANILRRAGHDERTQLYGLLHDASEAYLVDIPSPFKYKLPKYLKWEVAAQRVILQGLGLAPMTKAQAIAVKNADREALVLEKAVLFSNNGNLNTGNPYNRFMNKFCELYRYDK